MSLNNFHSECLGDISFRIAKWQHAFWSCWLFDATPVYLYIFPAYFKVNKEIAYLGVQWEFESVFFEPGLEGKGKITLISV